jgi:hypothetical protein
MSRFLGYCDPQAPTSLTCLALDVNLLNNCSRGVYNFFNIKKIYYNTYPPNALF